MEEIKKLEGWLTFPEAASVLGISKQGFHKMVEVQKVVPLEALRKVGNKPIYLVQTRAIHVLKEDRDKFAKDLAFLKFSRNLSDLIQTDLYLTREDS